MHAFLVGKLKTAVSGELNETNGFHVLVAF
jgi:hypothetical protein